MTAQSLQSYTIKDLAEMARKRGVNGWHAMRKDQLVRALVRAAAKRGGNSSGKSSGTKAPSQRSTSRSKRISSASRNGSPAHKSTSRHTTSRNGSSRSVSRPLPNPRVIKRLEEAKARLMKAKILATNPTDGKLGSQAKDRLVVMVRGPFWLHAHWELTPAGLVRAQAALGELWHAARPVLRLLEISATNTSTPAESVARDIFIHGGVTDWYIDVMDPPKTFRVEIGYLAANGRFFSLARSNTVTTPASASSDKLDEHWTDVVQDCDKIYAMSGGYSPETNAGELQEVLEERLRRPVGSTMSDRYGGGAESLVPRSRAIRFNIDAEMIIHGTTHPEAHVTLQGAPIKLRPDGSFSVRLDMPNRRQVIPLTASSRDGTSQRTIVLAVERNTKAMEPINQEASE